MTERGAIEIAPASLHAGPDAQRSVHRARRGAEHDLRADEDVPDAAGFDSRMVITGDVTQVDLPSERAPPDSSRSRSVLKHVPGSVRLLHREGRRAARLVSEISGPTTSGPGGARSMIVVANRQPLSVDLARIRRTLRTALRALGVWDHELSLTAGRRSDDPRPECPLSRGAPSDRRPRRSRWPVRAAILGEAIISVETARRQARALGHSLRGKELDLSAATRACAFAEASTATPGEGGTS